VSSCYKNKFRFFLKDQTIILFWNIMRIIKVYIMPFTFFSVQYLLLIFQTIVISFTRCIILFKILHFFINLPAKPKIYVLCCWLYLLCTINRVLKCLINGICRNIFISDLCSVQFNNLKSWQK